MSLKKIISALLFAILVVFAGMTCRAAEVNSNYLNGNKNFPMIDWKQGVSSFLDKSSLVCERYDPPYYILAVNVLYVDHADKGNTTPNVIRTFRIFYNYNKTEMYNITKDKRGLTTSYYIDPNGCEAQKSVVMPAGEAAFYLCYNLKFYGTLYQKFGNEYYPVFSDEFYDHLK